MNNVNTNRILAYLLFSLLLLQVTIIEVNAQSTSGQVTIDFNGFGIASVRQTTYVSDVEVLGVIGKLLYITSVAPSNVTYYAENNTIVLVPPQGFTGLVEIDYISQVALPSNDNWIANFTSSTNSTVILPLGAIPLNIIPLPLNFTVTADNRLAFIFPPGNVSIVYALSQSTSTSTNIPPSQGGGTSTTTSTQPVTSTSNLLYLIIAVIFIPLALILLFLGKRFFRK
ncbi:MAG: hypothetical protein ACP5GN_00415 [Fervidicoccaceae archaeon]